MHPARAQPVVSARAARVVIPQISGTRDRDTPHGPRATQPPRYSPKNRISSEKPTLSACAAGGDRHTETTLSSGGRYHMLTQPPPTFPAYTPSAAGERRDDRAGHRHRQGIRALGPPPPLLLLAMQRV